MKSTTFLLAALAIAGCADMSDGSVAGSEADLGTAGRLDGAFGSNGTVQVGLDPQGRPGHSSEAGAVWTASDGSIYVAGIYAHRADDGSGVSDDLVVVHYTTNGKVDPTFATNGAARVALPPTNDAGLAVRYLVHAMQRTADGRIVVAASQLVDRTHDVRRYDGGVTVARFDARGQADVTFGTGGVIQTAFPQQSTWQRHRDTPRAIAVDAGGRVLVAGDSVEATPPTEYPPATRKPTGAVLRLLGDGSPDPTFAAAASLASPGDWSLSGFEVPAIVPLPDGRILVAASVSDDGYHFPFVVRLADSGKVDPTFAGDLTPWVPLGGARPQMRSIGALSVDAAGNILVAGSGVSGGTSQADDAKVKLDRFDANGRVDATFGQAGHLAIDIGPQPSPTEWANAVTVMGVRVLADGKILTAGAQIQAFSRQTSFFAARVAADGAPDATFADNGLALSAYGRIYDVEESVSLGSGSSTTVTRASIWDATCSIAPNGAITFAGGNATPGTDTDFTWSSLLRRFR